MSKDLKRGYVYKGLKGDKSIKYLGARCATCSSTFTLYKPSFLL